MIQKISLADEFAKFSDAWKPRIAGDINQMQIKLAKFSGEFVWHHHENEDELFLVIKGRLLMRLRDGNLRVGPGEFVIVPRGVEHLPIAEEDCEVVLIEPRTTLNTGNVTNGRTLRNLERIT
jgi:mannose-6-phosphate isomerase-like protein (cupin superfamily)